MRVAQLRVYPIVNHRYANLIVNHRNTNLKSARTVLSKLRSLAVDLRVVGQPVLLDKKKHAPASELRLDRREHLRTVKVIGCGIGHCW